MIITKYFESFNEVSDDYLKIIKEVFLDEEDTKVPSSKGYSFTSHFGIIPDSSLFAVMYGDDNVSVSAGRILFVNNRFEIGPIGVKKAHRGENYGSTMVKTLINRIAEMGGTKQYLAAKAQAIQFYKKIGFVEFESTYSHFGITFQHMVHEGNCIA
mgnify:CR=1 FL=1